jgi:hypothetical protein
MEHQLWKEIVAWLARLSKPRFHPKEGYGDDRIIAVYFWSVLHDRPIYWACEARNWPIWLRKERLPSRTTMSRRLRSKSVQRRLTELEQHVVRPRAGGLVWFIDGKPLVIGGCSKDRQAGYGRAAGCKAKGYKIHAIVGDDNSVAQWRLAPMNVDERKMAKRMLRVALIQGYVVGDSNYDSNELHRTCDERGNLQMVVPRRYGPGRGHGHRKQTAGRMRSKEMLENPFPHFGRDLLKQRAGIERHYGNLTNWGGGLTHLPPWVRTYRRVYRWVQAKFVLNQLKRRAQLTTYIA